MKAPAPPDRHQRRLPPGTRRPTRRTWRATRTTSTCGGSPPRRLEAEVVRDCVFFVAGQLDLTMGGPDIDHTPGADACRAAASTSATPPRSRWSSCSSSTRAGVTRVLPAQAERSCRSRRWRWPTASWPCGTPGCWPAACTRSAAATRRRSSRPAFERVLSRPPTAEELAECVAFLSEQTAALRPRRQPSEPGRTADGTQPRREPRPCGAREKPGARAAEPSRVRDDPLRASRAIDAVTRTAGSTASALHCRPTRRGCRHERPTAAPASPAARSSPTPAWASPAWPWAPCSTATASAAPARPHAARRPAALHAKAKSRHLDLPVRRRQPRRELRRQAGADQVRRQDHRRDAVQGRLQRPARQGRRRRQPVARRPPACSWA